ncbi:unnamed protein product [Adineta steineri]|uniref:Uncharacterized protein n=1 Tax=Adineta steineri TaxID=433720 RepID=A0A814IU71_9BILA|nr:unnamed protein product [Adineta steineri]CAF3797928.1 unnamed protein product [Adineta steineri]
MLKLIIFTLFLISTPSFGLLENLFQAERNCYSGCRANYATSFLAISACQAGCDFKIQNENCADQCKLYSVEEQMEASCLVGCSMNDLEIHSRPKSITFIRFIRHPLEISNEPKTTSEDLTISDKIKKIFQLTKDFHFNFFNDTKTIHQDKLETSTRYFQQYASNVHDQWNNLLHTQRKTTVWVLLSIFLLSSIILLYMIVSLCRRKPGHHGLSIGSREFLIDNTYENEKVQPYAHYYDLTRSSPIKVKLANH